MTGEWTETSSREGCSPKFLRKKRTRRLRSDERSVCCASLSKLCAQSNARDLGVPLAKEGGEVRSWFGENYRSVPLLQ